MSILPSGALPTDRPPSASVGGTGVIPDGSITAAKLADGVQTNAVRQAALFTEGATSYATAAWAPSTTARTGVEFTHERLSDNVVNNLVGRGGAGWLATRRVGGTFYVTMDGSDVLGIADAVPLGGGANTYRVIYDAGVVTLMRNGIEIGSVASSVVMAGVAANHTFGAPGITTVGGTLYDVKLIDPADDTNTAVYTLDGPSGFENSHPGSTVADATVTGNVSYALVPSSDGGRPVKVGREVYLHSVTATSQVITSSNKIVNFSSVGLDETGSLAVGSDNFFTAPVAGIADVTVIGSAGANADAADDVQFVLDHGGVAVGIQDFEAGVRSGRGPLAVNGSVAMSQGDTLGVQFAFIAASTTLDLLRCSVQLRFYPTPT